MNDQAYRFWLNNDNDGLQDEIENIDSNIDDFEDDVIWSRRDLEDFSRFWINATNILSQLQSGTLTLGLRWQGFAGDPTLKLFQSCETDGGKKYLEDENVASEQVSEEYNHALADTKNGVVKLKPGKIFQFSKVFWASVSANNPVAHLLFEAAGEGKGQLTTVLWDSQGREIGRGPAHYFQLMDVRKMYYRAKALPEEIPAPYDYLFNQPPDPNMTFEMDPVNPNDPDPSKNAFVPYHFENYKANAVVFVHGWNMSPEEARNFSLNDTKRGKNNP